jgi:hypothetical protein
MAADKEKENAGMVTAYDRMHNKKFWEELITKVKVKIMLRPTVSRPVYLGINTHLGPKITFFITVRQLQAC